MAKIEVFKRFSATKLKSEFGFRVVANNGEIIASSEGYASKSNAQRGAENLVDTIIQMVAEGVTYEDV